MPDFPPIVKTSGAYVEIVTVLVRFMPSMIELLDVVVVLVTIRPVELVIDVKEDEPEADEEEVVEAPSPCNMSGARPALELVEELLEGAVGVFVPVDDEFEKVAE